MPAGWVHAVIDLIAYDAPMLDLHQWKDEPWQRLGYRHRVERHAWYQAGRAGVWSLDEPTPPWVADNIRAIGEAHGDEAAERYMADLSHDLWDLVWDGMPRVRRLLIEGFFAWVLFRPDILETRFRVDVVRGRIERQIDGVLRWEAHPAVIRPYRNLCQYVRRVLDRDRRLSAVVAAYEAHEIMSPWLGPPARPTLNA
jgi:hypothetical protein